MPHETRSEELDLSTLEEKGGSGDLIALYQRISEMELLDRNDLIEKEERSQLKMTQKEFEKWDLFAGPT